MLRRGYQTVPFIEVSLTQVLYVPTNEVELWGFELGSRNFDVRPKVFIRDYVFVTNHGPLTDFESSVGVQICAFTGVVSGDPICQEFF